MNADLRDRQPWASYGLMHRSKAGISGVLLRVARTRGYRRVSLETGTGPAFEPALALYRKRGFVKGEVFGDYKPTTFNQFYHVDLIVSGEA